MHRFIKLMAIMAGLLATLASSAQKQTEYVFPQASFNEEAVARQMEDGTAMIQGIAKLKKKGVTYHPFMKQQIQLFPVTPYLEEFLQLKKKYNKGRKIASISNTAFCYHIEGRTIDDQGGFEFRDLKPGRYYVVTWIAYEKKYNYSVQTGRETAYNGYGEPLWSVPTYTTYTYRYAVDQEVSGIVEVKSEGEKVSMVISN